MIYIFMQHEWVTVHTWHRHTKHNRGPTMATSEFKSMPLMLMLRWYTEPSGWLDTLFLIQLEKTQIIFHSAGVSRDFFFVQSLRKVAWQKHALRCTTAHTLLTRISTNRGSDVTHTHTHAHTVKLRTHKAAQYTHICIHLLIVYKKYALAINYSSSSSTTLNTKLRHYIPEEGAGAIGYESCKATRLDRTRPNSHAEFS